MKQTVYVLLTLAMFCVPSAHAKEVLMVTWQGKFISEVAFEKRLRELVPDVKFTYLDASRQKKHLSELLRNYDFSKTDLVYSFGTTGTKMVKGILKNRKPVIFNMVSAPVLSGIVDSIEHPGGNITGAKILMYPGDQIKFFMKLKKIERLALWFDPREKQSTIVYKAISLYGKGYGIDIRPFRIIPDSPNAMKRIRQAAKMSNKMDALYFVTGSSFAVHAKKLMALLDPGLLILGSLNTDVMAGATVAIGPDLSERGKVAAEMAEQILKGEKASEIPVSIVDEKNAVLFVNKNKVNLAGLENLERLGVKIVEIDAKGLPGQDR